VQSSLLPKGIGYQKVVDGIFLLWLGLELARIVVTQDHAKDF
jgi:hypothetical protein